MNQVPSKTTTRNAGRTLRHAEPGSAEYKTAFDIISKWRERYQPLLDRVGLYFRRKVSRIYSDDSTIVAQRMKRMPSIANKLRRFSTDVTRMQDIAGLRIVLPKMEDVLSFQASLLAEGVHCFKYVDTDDYISKPKPDGYRCLHEIFSYSCDDKPENKGCCIEIQIRTLLQHLWATSVESLDVLMKTSLKTGQANAPHLEFVKLASALFSYDEGTPVMDELKGVEPRELVRRIMVEGRQFDKYLQENTDPGLVAGYPGEDDAYTLLSLDIPESGDPFVSIIPFKKGQGNNAMSAYGTREAANDGKDDVLMVLVQAGGSMKKLEEAYPNYFLKLDTFKTELERICKKYS